MPALARPAPARGARAVALICGAAPLVPLLLIGGMGVLDGCTGQQGDAPAAADASRTEDGNVDVDSNRPADAAVEATVPSLGPAILPTFFGKHWHKITDWPTTKFGAGAIGPGINWALVETQRGTYDYSPIDTWVAAAKSPGHGQDLTWMYAAIRTPLWAGGTGSPPTDLYTTAPCEGSLAGVTTTDCAFKEFLTSVLDHACTGTAPNKTCSFKSWELHNEGNASDAAWGGTYAELAQMDSDALVTIKSHCASCLVLSSNVSAGGDGYHAKGLTSPRYDVFMRAYLDEWQKLGTPMPDVLAWHPYPSHDNIASVPFPETLDGSACLSPAPNKVCVETIVSQVQKMRGIADAHGMQGRALWATEGSFGPNSALPDADARAAYVARWLLALAGGGVERSYWYAWDDPTWATELINGQLTSVAIAAEQVYDWLVGNSFDAPCSNGSSGTVWTCNLKGPGGLLESIVWDTSGPSAYTVPPNYDVARDLGGPTRRSVSNPVTIGLKPMAFTNRSAARPTDGG